jgi:hypothetical protein
MLSRQPSHFMTYPCGGDRDILQGVGDRGIGLTGDMVQRLGVGYRGLRIEGMAARRGLRATETFTRLLSQSSGNPIVN